MLVLIFLTSAPYCFRLNRLVVVQNTQDVLNQRVRKEAPAAEVLAMMEK